MHLALLVSRIRLSPAAMPSTRSASASRLLVRADLNPGEAKAFSSPRMFLPLLNGPLLSSAMSSCPVYFTVWSRGTILLKWYLPSRSSILSLLPLPQKRKKKISHDICLNVILIPMSVWRLELRDSFHKMGEISVLPGFLLLVSLGCLSKWYKGKKIRFLFCNFISRIVFSLIVNWKLDFAFGEVICISMLACCERVKWWMPCSCCPPH